MQTHEQQAQAYQTQVWRNMTPAQKYRCMVDLLEFTRRCKRARLRAMHPDWDEQRLEQAVREAFLYAHT